MNPTPEQLLAIRLDMYKFSHRIGLDEIVAQIIAQNASDSVRRIGQHEGCENDRENAKRIFNEVRLFCIETLGYKETRAELIASHSAFCGDVCTIHWQFPALYCDLPRGHSNKQHEDDRDADKRTWSWNPLFKRTVIRAR